MTEPEKLDEERQSAEAFAVVGELVMTSSLLDSQLNRVLVTMLDFGENPMIESVIATFDPVRKIEILKARASHMPKGDWRKNVGKYSDHVDAVFKQRNIACHTPPAFKDGVWTFKAVCGSEALQENRPDRQNGEAVDTRGF